MDKFLPKRSQNCKRGGKEHEVLLVETFKCTNCINIFFVCLLLNKVKKTNQKYVQTKSPKIKLKTSENGGNIKKIKF